MCVCFGTAVSFYFLELCWDHCCKGQMQLLLWNIQSQKPKGEGGRQNPTVTCNIKQQNQRRGWFVLLTKLSKICLRACVSKPKGSAGKGITAGQGEAEVCGWHMKDTAPAGDAAHPPGKWLHTVWDVVPVLPQGLVSQILQNRGPMESHSWQG